MTAKYAQKAQKFVVKNPDASASPAQRKQIGYLLRTVDHDVDFGNLVVELITEDTFTRGQADACIKKLALGANTKAPVASRKPAQPVSVVKCDHDATLIKLGQMARNGKLGTVARRKAALVG